jgi:hypothetical protein
MQLRGYVPRSVCGLFFFDYSGDNLDSRRRLINNISTPPRRTEPLFRTRILYRQLLIPFHSLAFHAATHSALYASYSPLNAIFSQPSHLFPSLIVPPSKVPSSSVMKNRGGQTGQERSILLPFHPDFFFAHLAGILYILP